MWVSRYYNSIYLKIIPFLLAGSIMIGHGARMIYQGVIHPNSVYKPGLFDLYFDWLSLLVLGIFILSFALYNFYTGVKQHSPYDEFYQKHLN